MSAKRALAGGVAVLLLGAAAATARVPFCLPDADGDGHPLFGNPEVILNPFAPLMGLNVVPVSGAIGDLDGDGDVDAVATFAAQTPSSGSPTQVSVLLNKGDGVFVVDAVYEPGDFPSCAAIGDLNGNGLGDLAITNVFAGTVSVLINTGSVGASPSFPNRVAYAVGTKPRSVVMADLDGDSDLDLAVANGMANTVSVLLNNGDGTFGPAASYAVANIPDASVLLGSSGAFGGPYLAAGDLDGDADVDLVVPVSTGVSVLKNNGPGTFAAQTTFAAGGSVWGVAIGNIDQDTDADLVTANFASDTLSVLKNNGNATFAAPETFTVVPVDNGGVFEPTAVSLGDADGDGDLDLAAGLAHNAGIVSVWKNPGDGNFADLTVLSAERDARLVWWSDLNGDGYRDLSVLARDPAAQKLCSLLNDGTGQLLVDQINYDLFNPPVPNPWNEASQIEFADLDDDYDLDIAVASPGDPIPNVAIVISAGNGAFETPVHYPIDGYYPGSLGVADLDRNGAPDLVVAGPESFAMASPAFVGVLLNNAAPSFVGPISYATGGLSTLALQLRDIDGDDDRDVVTTNLASNNVSLFLSNGEGNLGSPALLELQTFAPGFFAAGDLDGDEDQDIVVGHFGTVEILTLWNLGDGTFSAGPLYDAPPQASRLALADFDHDCDLDLVVSSNNTPAQFVTFAVFVNDGAGVFGPPSQYSSPGTADARTLRTADLDSDGHLDVAVSTRGAVSVFLGNGDATFGPSASYGCGSDIQGIAAGDLDGDGDTDLGVANLGDDSFSILWNQRCVPHPFPPPWDFDADGDVDLDDWAGFLSCLSGPDVCLTDAVCNPPGVASADLDTDRDVDLRDTALFLNVFGL